MNDVANKEKQDAGIWWVSKELQKLMTFVEVCQGGLSLAASAVEVQDTLRLLDEDAGEPSRIVPPEVYKKRLEEAKKHEDFAQQELPAGFPYLLSLAAIRMWSLMESAFDQLIVYVLRVCPQTRQMTIIQKLKGPLVPFACLSPDEQAEFLLTQLKDEVRANFLPGTGRFEAMLKAIGLGGPVHGEVRRALLELSEVRHVFVHRRGEADAKLLERCPWLPFKVGDQVKVREPELRSFFVACVCYVLEIDRRLTLFENRTWSPLMAAAQARMEKRIVDCRAACHASAGTGEQKFK
jgi:hypothetical protein